MGRSKENLAAIGIDTDNWDWQTYGICNSVDPELFFHPDGEQKSAKEQRIANAKKICAGCPVIFDCRKHALNVREPYGIWGGMSEAERRKALRKNSENSSNR